MTVSVRTSDSGAGKRGWLRAEPHTSSALFRTPLGDQSRIARDAPASTPLNLRWFSSLGQTSQENSGNLVARCAKSVVGYDSGTEFAFS